PSILGVLLPMTRAGSLEPAGSSPPDEGEDAMSGSDDLRELEYAALMAHVRELDRTALASWLAAPIAAAVPCSTRIGALSAGLMLPAVLCMAFGYYAKLQVRRKGRLIEGYVQEYFENGREGAQWHARLAQLFALPGTADGSEWMPLALSNLVTLVAVILSWTFAEGSSRGEFLAGFTTVA